MTVPEIVADLVKAEDDLRSAFALMTRALYSLDRHPTCSVGRGMLYGRIRRAQGLTSGGPKDSDANWIAEVRERIELFHENEMRQATLREELRVRLPRLSPA